MVELENLQKVFLAHLQGKLTPIKHYVAKEQPGLAIYANAYHQRLREALDGDYPCLGLLLGDEQFNQLVSDYITYHPSSDPSLRWFGQHLPAFVREQAHYQAMPIVAELAEWEWRLRLAFDAAGSEIAVINHVQQLTADQWPTLRFELVPSLQLVSWQTNAVAVWQALEQQQTPPAIAEEHTDWIIWRKGLVTNFRSIHDDERAALTLTLQGHNFASLCEHLCQWHEPEAVTTRVVQLLQQWLSDELIKQVIS
ncbi:HvfC/BufC N-terminal domain-containing protein [Zooshikella sp. RANM57]|uniref:HvfC/BufC N-terminal domain-containing protein n=1 Tax=Zooshikella sp. RANM57 TaxID=3425863 RepID=UPI003D6FFE3C